LGPLPANSPSPPPKLLGRHSQRADSRRTPTVGKIWVFTPRHPFAWAGSLSGTAVESAPSANSNSRGRIVKRLRRGGARAGRITALRSNKNRNYHSRQIMQSSPPDIQPERLHPLILVGPRRPIQHIFLPALRSPNEKQ
jgi:hypothetical protein